MNPRTTWILLLLAASLGVFVFLNERQAGTPSAPDDPVLRALPAFTPDMVTSVEVITQTNLIFNAVRTNKEWQLTHPMKYPAYGARVEGLLPVFSQLSPSAHVSAQEMKSSEQSMAAFGLAPPVASISVTVGSNRWDLKVGGKTMNGKQVYVQLVGSDGVYFPDASFLSLLPRAADDWRDPFFLRMNGLEFNRLAVKHGTGDYELQKDASSSRWKLSRPLEARANHGHILRVIETLKNWQVAKFADLGANSDLESLGLRPPLATLTLGQGTNTVLTAYFGKSPTNDESLVYALCPGPQASVVLVPRDRLSLLQMPAPYTGLRDQGLLPVTLAPVTLIDVDCQGGEKFTLEKKDTDSWVVRTGTNSYPGDLELVRHFLSDISTAGIVEFTKDVATEQDFKEKGLLPPRRSYVFRTYSTNSVTGETNPPVARADFSMEQDGKMFARVLGENSIYAARADLVNRLPVQPFQLWDRKLWQFQTNQVNSLTLSAGGETLGAKRDGSRQWVYLYNAKPLDEMKWLIMDEFLYRLGTLRAEAWVPVTEDKLAFYGLTTQAVHVRMELAKEGKPAVLEIDLGTRAMSGNNYASIVWNGRKVVFELTKDIYTYLGDLVNNWKDQTPDKK